MKNARKHRKAASVSALLLVLCILLSMTFAGCGEGSGDASGKDPAETSGRQEGTSGTPSDGTSDIPLPEEEEDYPPMEIVYEYDGDRTLRMVFLSNSETSLSYQVILEGKTEDGWEVPEGVTEPPSGVIQAYGIDRHNFSLDEMPLKEQPDFRILCRYQTEDGKAREIPAELHFGDAQTSDARLVFGSVADPAWSVDDQGRCLLSFVSEEKGRALTEGSESGLFFYTLSYADVAKIGDKTGAYDFYDKVSPPAFGVVTEEGAKLSLNTMLGGKETLREGTQYDLCLTIFCVAEDEHFIEALYITTRVDYTAEDAEILKDAMDFIEYEDNIQLDKPVLYLYPEKETDVMVRLTVDGEITASWPPYEDGWKVTASPDGCLTDAAGNEYPYLFYELSQNLTPDFSKGFCVPGEQTGEFLRTVLSEMGLTPEEYTDFIVYWLPRMQENRYNVITFCGEEYAKSAKLDISPAPDSLLRICMVYYGSDTPVEIAPQTFTPFVREGFTAVEWGGGEFAK